MVGAGMVVVRMRQLLYEEENGVKVYFAVVPASKIRFNPHNPNVMSDVDFARLRDNIEKYGYVEPAVVGVVEEDGEEVYYVIDGEHRIRAMLGRGYEQIPVILVEGLSRVAVLSGAYTFNRIRGRIDPARLNQLIRFLGEKYEADIIAEWLGESRGFVERVIREAERTSEVLVESVSTQRVSTQAVTQPAAQTAQSRFAGGRPAAGGAERRQGGGRLEDAVATARVMLMIPLSRDDHQYAMRILRTISSNVSSAFMEVVRFYAEQNGLEEEEEDGGGA